MSADDFQDGADGAGLFNGDGMNLAGEIFDAKCLFGVPIGAVFELADEGAVLGDDFIVHRNGFDEVRTGFGDSPGGGAVGDFDEGVG